MFGEAVRKSGIKKGDIIVSCGERDDLATAGAFHMELRLRYYKPGSVVTLGILRGGAREKLSVEF